MAVEALYKTACAIPPHPRVFVLAAAMAAGPGLAPFYSYGDGVPGSSSLSEALVINWGALDAGWPPVTFVPTLSLATLLDAIPSNLSVVLLKTDAQGWDDVVLRSAGETLARVQVVQSEVFCPGTNLYKGVVNTWASVNAVLSPLGFEDTAGDRCAKKESSSYHDAVFVSPGCKGPYCDRRGLEIHLF